MERKNSDSQSYEELNLRGISCWILLILPIFLFITGFWNLYLASELGQQEGYNLYSLAVEWNRGVDITAQYSEIYLLAMKRLTTALIQLSFGLMTFLAGLFLAHANKEEKLKQRNLNLSDE